MNAYTTDLAVTTAAANIGGGVHRDVEERIEDRLHERETGSHGRWACSANLLKVGVAPGSMDLAAQAFNTSEQAIKGASDVRSSPTLSRRRGRNRRDEGPVRRMGGRDTHTEVDELHLDGAKGLRQGVPSVRGDRCPNASAKTESEPVSSSTPPSMPRR